jgi:hypothetical protein
MEDYIEEKRIEFAMNIDEYSIGEKLKDSGGNLCEIVTKTINSIELFKTAKTKKGVDCKQWYNMQEITRFFNKQS